MSKTRNTHKPAVLKPVSLFLLPIGLSIISSISHGFISQCKLRLLEGENINIHRPRIHKPGIDGPRIDRPRIHRPRIIPHFDKNKLFRTADLREEDLQKAYYQQMNSREDSLRIIDFEAAKLPKDDDLNGTITLNASMNKK